jgi:hypothetical protein
MDNECVHNLQQTRELLIKLPEGMYTEKLEILDQQSIGSHVRHILEFYVCLLVGLKQQSVSYDARKRDLVLESCKQTAIELIDILTVDIANIVEDKPLKLISDCSQNSSEKMVFDSSIYRELYYNLEHSVHHLALIKIALKQNGVSYESMKNLGVASSTLKFRAQQRNLELNEAQ